MKKVEAAPRRHNAPARGPRSRGDLPRRASRRAPRHRRPRRPRHRPRRTRSPPRRRAVAASAVSRPSARGGSRRGREAVARAARRRRRRPAAPGCAAAGRAPREHRSVGPERHDTPPRHRGRRREPRLARSPGSSPARAIRRASSRLGVRRTAPRTGHRPTWMGVPDERRGGGSQGRPQPGRGRDPSSVVRDQHDVGVAERTAGGRRRRQHPRRLAAGVDPGQQMSGGPDPSLLRGRPPAAQVDDLDAPSMPGAPERPARPDRRPAQSRWSSGPRRARARAAARPAPPGRSRTTISSSTGAGASGHRRSARPSRSRSSRASPTTTTRVIARPPGRGCFGRRSRRPLPRRPDAGRLGGSLEPSPLWGHRRPSCRGRQPRAGSVPAR